MRLYLGGKFSARFRLREIRAQLRALGFSCDSTGMDDDGGDYPVPRERALLEAPRDLAQIRAAQVFVLDTLDDSRTGGREVEYGFSLGWASAWQGLGLPAPLTVLVGPVRNIFHELADHRCADWPEALGVLARLTGKTA